MVNGLVGVVYYHCMSYRRIELGPGDNRHQLTPHMESSSSHSTPLRLLIIPRLCLTVSLYRQPEWTSYSDPTTMAAHP